jgi:Zn ribbon nucleic-acid-binding protein
MTEFKMVEPSRKFGKYKPKSSYCSTCASSAVLKIFSDHRLRSVKCYTCGIEEIINDQSGKSAHSTDTAHENVQI